MRGHEIQFHEIVVDIMLIAYLKPDYVKLMAGFELL